jgi:hypothetical protein
MTNSISCAPLDAERAPVTVVARAALGAQAAVPRARPWRGMLLTVLACGFLAAGLAEAVAQTSGIEEEVSERGVAPKLALTPAQRGAIYQEVHRDRSKVAPSRFAAHVGAEVPPMIELYTLPATFSPTVRKPSSTSSPRLTTRWYSSIRPRCV